MMRTRWNFCKYYLAMKSDNQHLNPFCKIRNKIVIFGCGGHARSIIDVIRENNQLSEILLVDKNVFNNEIILGCKTKCNYKLHKLDKYIVGIGNNNRREKVYNDLNNLNIGYNISIVSISSHIGINTKLGKGNFIARNVHIGPQVQIGNNSIINTGSIIEHDVRIGNSTHIAPNVTICGYAKVGNNVFCGAGSTIINKIKICDNVIIGAGAVVKNNILEQGVYVGVPAKKIN